MVRLLRSVRFSLATFLLAIASIAIWLGIVLHQVRERRAVLNWIEATPGCCYRLYKNPLQDWPDPNPGGMYSKVENISRLYMLFGDEPVFYINVCRSNCGWEERQRIARLFPEGFVVPERPTGFVVVEADDQSE